MNQTQHIFAKDARRFWAEIALSVAITAAFVFLEPYEWIGKYEPQNGSLMTLAALLTGLVPVSWWVAITRVVHEERLVGDTQFWITRPYAWTSLLAAKLAFVLAFLYVPLFLAQLALLAQAGFAPLAYLPGLLYNLLLITCLIALPLAAIASVTSSFARMTLTLLGILVGIIAFFTFASLADSYWTSDEGGSLGNRISIALVFVVLAIAIVLQYARRTVWSSRRLLIALPLLLLAVGFSASKYEQAQIDRIYLPAQAGTPIRLAYSPDQASYETSSFEASPRAQIPIKIRLAESGVGDGFLVLIDAVRVELRAPDGSHWESQWRRVGGYKFLPGELRFSPTFQMPNSGDSRARRSVYISPWRSAARRRARSQTCRSLRRDFRCPTLESVRQNTDGRGSLVAPPESPAYSRCTSHRSPISALTGQTRNAPVRLLLPTGACWARHGWARSITSRRSWESRRSSIRILVCRTVRTTMGAEKTGFALCARALPSPSPNTHGSDACRPASTFRPSLCQNIP
jgi:hypothetical protein